MTDDDLARLLKHDRQRLEALAPAPNPRALEALVAERARERLEKGVRHVVQGAIAALLATLPLATALGAGPQVLIAFAIAALWLLSDESLFLDARPASAS